MAIQVDRNKFAIQVSDDDGNATCSYEGNWRDIFQNWEALCSSFPRLFRVSSLSLLMQQIDGFNRIVFHEPVSTGKALLTMILGRISDIGDHQIAYLLALLESSERHHPATFPLC